MWINSIIYTLIDFSLCYFIAWAVNSITQKIIKRKYNFKKEYKMKNKEEEYKKAIAKRNKIALEVNTKAINYLQENKNDIKTLFCAGITESDNKIHVEMNIIGRELSYILHCLMLNDDGIYTAVKEAVDTVTLIKSEQNGDKR